MNVVYEPKGRAGEYSELACNLYLGCTHGCRYCYAPACMRTTRDKWHTKAEPRPNVIKHLEKEARKLQGDHRRILFSFLSDPYQPLERKERLTRQALEIVYKFNLNSQILTKGSSDLVLDDLDLMKKANTQLGISISFINDEKRSYWEPNASSINDRLKILKYAFESGIFTWVSLEPVIDTVQALDLIQKANKYVHFWKVGKLNHFKEYEKKVDWGKFLNDVEALLKKNNAKYYIKKDLKIFEKVQ